ncbi:DUF3616 domain-containing protein [Methylotetracoccus oryzae]|uniref:DUF3616 domain-containing protein n=1 Tax=Methylotetracoccus oryzae TaxID=1919059 RepID=UPI001119A654|nr:DUF3616 domain-containing protein [Methylotetracoccus oryzae]
MKHPTSPCPIGLIVALAALSNAHSAELSRYGGMCDASAAAPIGRHYFVVANDKDSVLRVYDRDEPGQPFYEHDFTAFLGLADTETDLEGATRIGERIYWITSHSANPRGDADSRRRLFATHVQHDGRTIRLEAVGTPYRTLLEDLTGHPELRELGLDKAATLPPESEDGLNIEGLSSTPPGGLMIGFRNPRPSGKALLVPIENPEDVMQGRIARFGSPVLLDLHGRGVRSIEYADALGQYLIVAGPHDDEGTFQVYEWTGRPADPPKPVSTAPFAGLNPEALVLYPDEGSREQVLSDDRGEEVNGTRCLRRTLELQSFRGLWIGH